MKFLKQSTYIRYAIAKLSKLVQIFENEKGPGTSFQAIFSIEFYDKKSYLVMLHKLAKFHYQAMFASQVIQ